MTWMTTKEAAEYTRYSVKSISRFCRDGKIQFQRVGSRGDYRFQKEWLDEFLGAPASQPASQPVSPPRIQIGQRSAALAKALSKKKKTLANSA